MLLAIASKNDEDAVREVFAEHDEMVLSASDLAAWQVGWQPKSQSLRAIAAELNIGLDSLVFVDDSDYELAEMRAAVPEVTCLRVPDETAELPDLIARSGLFRNLRISAEDLERTEMIRRERSRAARGATLSREDFLASLDLVVDYFPVRREHVGRVAQLTNKTNQFNLTTIRRSEPEIAALARVVRPPGPCAPGRRQLRRLRARRCRCHHDRGHGMGARHRAHVLPGSRARRRVGVPRPDRRRSHGARRHRAGRTLRTHPQERRWWPTCCPRHGFVAAADGSFRASPATVPGAPAHISFA